MAILSLFFFPFSTIVNAFRLSHFFSADLLEATTSALRAIVTKIAACDKSSATRPRLFAPTSREVNALVAIYKSRTGSGSLTEDRSIKINVVRIASSLAASAHAKYDSKDMFSVSYS